MPNLEFSNYLQIPYVKDHYPSNDAYSIESIRQKGTNCIGLVHSIYRNEFGVQLPIGLWTKELLEDEEFTRFVLPNEPYALGDIFAFGNKKQEIDKKGLHMAMYTGITQDDTPLLIHNTNRTINSSVIWPITQFNENPNYYITYGIKRLRQDLFDTFIKPLQNTAILKTNF